MPLLPTLALALLPSLASPGGNGGGRVDWFQGSFDELLAEAARTDRLVLVDFWTSWCGWCKRLDNDTYSDDAVVEALGELLCYSVDAESASGRPIARRYGATGYPWLLFLDPDGSERDVLPGYLPPEAFLRELERIRRNEGTVAALRARVDERPADLDARYALAVKLRDLGRDADFREQEQAIRRLDPKGSSLPSRRLELDRIVDGLGASGYDLAPLEAFLARESRAELLHRGWFVAWKIRAYLAGTAEDEASGDEHFAAWLRAGREAWRHVPDEEVVEFGNQLAWSLYEHRDRIGEDDVRFAIAVARRAAEAAPEVAAVLDTLACCLHMGGERAEALALLERCVALEPKNETWRRRLQKLGRRDDPRPVPGREAVVE